MKIAISSRSSRPPWWSPCTVEPTVARRTVPCSTSCCGSIFSTSSSARHRADSNRRSALCRRAPRRSATVSSERAPERIRPSAPGFEARSSCPLSYGGKGRAEGVDPPWAGARRLLRPVRQPPCATPARGAAAWTARRRRVVLHAKDARVVVPDELGELDRPNRDAKQFEQIAALEESPPLEDREIVRSVIGGALLSWLVSPVASVASHVTRRDRHHVRGGSSHKARALHCSCDRAPGIQAEAPVRPRDACSSRLASSATAPSCRLHAHGQLR